MKIKLKGEELELNGALPLRVRDWRDLEKAGVSMDAFTGENPKVSVEVMAQVAIKILSKVGKDEAFIDSLSLGELASVFSAGLSREADPAEVNRPT